jgi:hypothetical protein
MATTKEQIIGVERGFWESANDPSFFAQNMDDRAISIIEPIGFVPKKDAVEMAGQAQGWADIQMHDIKVAELNPECAIIAYHGEAKSAKDGKPYRASINSVYVRNGDKWVLGMTSHQAWQ